MRRGEALVRSEKRAVSIDTLNSSHCLSSSRRQFSRVASAADGRIHLPHAPAAPSSSCPSPARLLKHDYAALAPGRRARSREGHDEERTEAHDTGEIDCKKDELEVPMGTVRLVPASSTFRAPIWTRAHAP